MAVIMGNGGAVKVGTAAVAEIGDWTVTGDADMIKTTAFGNDGWQTQKPGMKSWNAKFAGHWDMTTGQNQDTLQTAWLQGTQVALKFYVDATKNYSGNAFIKNLSVKTPADGSVDADFSVEGTGALTFSLT